MKTYFRSDFPLEEYTMRFTHTSRTSPFGKFVRNTSHVNSALQVLRQLISLSKFLPISFRCSVFNQRMKTLEYSSNQKWIYRQNVSKELRDCIQKRIEFEWKNRTAAEVASWKVCNKKMSVPISSIHQFRLCSYILPFLKCQTSLSIPMVHH